MEFIEACKIAYQQSKAGYVQHVQKQLAGEYVIGNWYDESTAASYENGQLIYVHPSHVDRRMVVV